MQLILDSEPTLDIKRDMSAIEDIHTEKVVNRDIEQLKENNCNGNKENINGDVNVITNDEKNKRVMNAEIETLPNCSNFNGESKNTEDESSIKLAIKSETSEENVPEKKENNQEEESLDNGTGEEIQNTSPIKQELEENAEETVQEAIVEDQQDIISLKHEKIDEISDIAENESENHETVDVKEEPEAVLEEPVPDVVLEEPVPDVELEEPVPDVELEEPAGTIEKGDKNLESSENEDKHLESSKNEDKHLESSENEDKHLESSENENKHLETSENEDKHESSENEDKHESSENEDKHESSENEDKHESSENEDKLLESSENEDKASESSDNKDEHLDETRNEIEVPVCDSTEDISSKHADDSPSIELKDDMDVEEVNETTKRKENNTSSQPKEKPSAPVSSSIIDKPILCKLSNTLDILSDDEDEPPKDETPMQVDLNEKQCINIEDDDDIMLIDEDATKTETPQPVVTSNKEDTPITENKADSETEEKMLEENFDLFTKTDEKDSTHPEEVKDDSLQIKVGEKDETKQTEHLSPEMPLLPDNFLKSAKKNLADMTREDLEEFCILKIVESIVDRSNLSEIKNKMKSVAQGIDEYRKKAMMLTKQNRDLQVVLKSIQEEQKKITPGLQITPLKITRSVGMQVFMEKTGARRKNLAQLQNSTHNRQCPKSLPSTNLRPQKQPAATQAIPVPRLVPASPALKSPSTIPLVNPITPVKNATPVTNGNKNPTPSQKVAEKRQLNRTLSVTVDLTDDEPPAKVNNRTSPAPPVRVVPSQTLMANPRQPYPAAVSSPRKVYIPISGPQNQNIRPGQTIMLKTLPSPGLRPRGPTPQVARQPAGSVRANRAPTGKHPAALPDAMKQYQPPNWKALPPSPDLKLSKVENGIVISWKIEGYQEDSYEEIASYQLYAYQETSSPPSTSLWKKIGDVKALPLPMACTLTQFMAGFKYYFAVRAVDIRSRLGPFSVPGSILLLNKL